jgi:hypothetical protein
MKWIIALSFFITIQVLAFDPMAPPGYQQVESGNKTVTTKKVQKSDFVLRQIVIRKNQKSAVINGYVVNEGGYIKGARVTRIEANKVVLQLANKQKILRLKPNIARIRQ